MNDSDSGTVLLKTARGAGWVIGFRFATRLLGLISTLTLVRLLAPGDFGLVALANSFAQTVDAFANLSPQEAIIRERAPDRSMYDTGFTMNLMRGVVTAGVVAAAGPLAAEFFHEPRMLPVLLALALSLLIGAVENIATADFVRTFAFDREFRLWTIPRVVQVVATIALALLWRSYWALVCGIVIGRLLRTVLSYAMLPYWPRVTLRAWRRITGFTVWSWAIYMVSMLRDRVDTVLVGRFFSSSRVGIYALGNEIASLPTSELVDPLCRAVFPGFSQLRHQGHGVADTYLRLLGIALMLVLPAGVGIAMVAAPLVSVAFGKAWIEAIPIIRIVAVGATIAAVGNISSTLLSAHAMLRTIFVITLCGALVRGGLLLVLLPGGTLTTAAAVATGVVAAEQVATIGIVMSRFGIRAASLLRVVWRSVLGTAVMAGALIWLGRGMESISDAPWHDLLVTSGAGAAIYLAAVGAAWVAARRPDGPERDFLEAATRVLRRLVA